MPYAWLTQEMSHHVTTAGDTVIWLWARTTRRDLRHLLRHPDARGEVLLTATIARHRVLLSDFSDWHQVLNRAPHVPRTPDEDHATWWARAEPLIEDYHARITAAGLDGTGYLDLPDTYRDELERGWRAIFDPATWAPGESVQATVHELRVADITRAIRIR
ncbi:MAG: DUF3841 domain-containing protein [Actinobacteria bacterium]|uniref:Unannotated protein n=1 Tax=freshwater metagenome TaxID=449393 RepID=A0A6J6NCX7_9ZZZZ|nr:DUF3841 domain-containing protein [Actinomycetota bacterium]